MCIRDSDNDDDDEDGGDDDDSEAGAVDGASCDATIGADVESVVGAVAAGGNVAAAAAAASRRRTTSICGTKRHVAANATDPPTWRLSSSMSRGDCAVVVASIPIDMRNATHNQTNQVSRR